MTDEVIMAAPILLLQSTIGWFFHRSIGLFNFSRSGDAAWGKIVVITNQTGDRMNRFVARTLVLSVSLVLTTSGISPTTAAVVDDRPTIAQFIPQAAENSKLKPLSEQEISQRLQSLPNWTRDGKNLKYTHEFKNFVEAVSFVNCLISPSEKAGHHPDIFISYNRVTISLTTHDAGGLTKQDFELAETISQVVSEWMSGNVCLIVEGSGS